MKEWMACHFTDEELRRINSNIIDLSRAEQHKMATELLAHRTTMKRLEEWAVQLENASVEPGAVGRFIAAELRNRIRGG